MSLRSSRSRGWRFCAELHGVGFREHIVRRRSAQVNPEELGSYLIMRAGIPENRHPDSWSTIPDD